MCLLRYIHAFQAKADKDRGGYPPSFAPPQAAQKACAHHRHAKRHKVELRAMGVDDEEGALLAALRACHTQLASP